MDPHEVSNSNVTGAGLALASKDEGLRSLRGGSNFVDSVNLPSLQKAPNCGHVIGSLKRDMATSNLGIIPAVTSCSSSLVTAGQESPQGHAASLEEARCPPTSRMPVQYDGHSRHADPESSSTNVRSPPGTITSYDMEPQNPKQFTSQPNNRTRTIVMGQDVHSNGRETKSLKSSIADTKAIQLSKAIASDVANCLNTGQASQEDIQLIIQTRVLSLLDPNGTRKASKRTSDDAELDDTAQLRLKRVACKTCNKTMERPCDLK